MRSHQFCVYFFFLLFSLFFCKSEPLSNKDYSCVSKSISTSTEPRCGEVLTTSSGFISHKPYKPIHSNERCAWTLSFQASSRYDIDILYLGFPNSNDTISPEPSLIISTTPLFNPYLPTIFIPNTTGIFSFPESTLIITFSSGYLNGSDEYTGFILQYKRSDISPGSQLKHKIVMPRVMVNFTNEGRYSVGTALFPPENNTYPGTPYPIVYLEYGSTTCDWGCSTSLNVHHFNRNNKTVPWQFVARICCRQETAIIAGHDDLWMITVFSDEERERSDIILFNERCQN